MAKKKPQDKPDMAPAPAPQAEPRKGSRHKPRKMLALPPRIYALLTTLARRHGRPISWEHRILIEQALIAAKLLKPEDATMYQGDEGEPPE